MNNLILVVLPIVGLALGAGIGYFVRKAMAAKQIQTAEGRAEKILQEAKNKQNELMLQAKEKALKIIEQSKKDDEARRVELRGIQARLEKRESLFDQRLLDLESKQQATLAKQTELERIGSLSQEEAKQLLIAKTEQDIKTEMVTRINKIQDETSEDMERKAKQVLANVIQRCAISHAAEITTTTLDLPSDEMKGRIIGREGRNIRAFEKATGVDVIVDDTPGVVGVSYVSCLESAHLGFLTPLVVVVIARCFGTSARAGTRAPAPYPQP